MSVLPLLLIQVGTPPEAIRAAHGDLPEWFGNALGPLAREMWIIRAFDGEALPAPDTLCGAIITGSWAMVTERLPWSEALADWLRQAMAIDLPLFGVCYGHQLMTHALGGTVDYHPAGREIGTKTITLAPQAKDDPILAAMPAQFPAHLTHMQSVTIAPEGAQVLAASDHDRHQIIRYGRNAISSQFHPEFTPDICAAIIRNRADVLRAEGADPDALLAAVEDAPAPRDMLHRFVRLATDFRPAADLQDTPT